MIAIIFLQLILIMLIAPLFLGWIKKIKALLQNRKGASILQPYYDLLKHFNKDAVIASMSSWIFRFTPYIYFVMVLVAGALLPCAWFLSIINCDIFLWLAILAVGRFFLVLASFDTGSSFGGMGGARELFIAVLIEPAMLLALLTIVHRASSTDILIMADVNTVMPFALSNVLAMAAFFIVLLAEVGRIPVDNPDTHLELTMVHEGMLLEYSGKRLAMLEWGAMIKQLLFVTLFVLLFMPWKLPFTSIWLFEILWLLVKIFFVGALLAITEISTNKLRLFRVPGFLLVAALLSILSIIAQ